MRLRCSPRTHRCNGFTWALLPRGCQGLGRRCRSASAGTLRNRSPSLPELLRVCLTFDAKLCRWWGRWTHRPHAREPWHEMSGVDISAQIIWLRTPAKTGPQPTAIARNGATMDGGCEMAKAKNHICFRVDDIEEATSIMADEGFEPVSSCKFKGGGGMSYFDTDKVGGVLTELVEWPEKS